MGNSIWSNLLLKTAQEDTENSSLDSDSVSPSECFGSENQYFAMDLLNMQQSPDSGVGLDLAEIDAEEDTSPMLSDVMMTGGQPFYSYSELSYSTTTPSLVDDHHINLDINMLTDEDLFMMDSLADDTEQQQEVNHFDKLPTTSNNEDVLNIKSEPEVKVDE